MPLNKETKPNQTLLPLIFSVIYFMYVFTQPLCHRLDVTQGQFLSRVLLGLRFFTLTGCLLLSITRRAQMNSCLSQGHYHKVKHKQPHPGFELGLPIPFPMMVTITLRVPPAIVSNSISNYVSRFYNLGVS